MAKKQASSQGDLFKNPFSSSNSLENIADFSKNTTFIKDKDGVDKPIGTSVTEKALSDAQTKEEVDASITLGQEIQRDADSNKKILDVVNTPPVNNTTVEPVNPNIGNGSVLGSAIAFDKNAERELPPLTVSDVEQSLLELSPEAKQQMLNEFNNYADSNRKNAVFPALERLGVQDYYPDINKDIAVGSYSRKTLGSGNIYVAQGGLLPRTVIDARDRAIQAQAMQKQSKIDAIKSKRFVTSEQFQQKYDDAYLDWLNENIRNAGANVDLLTDPSTEMGRKFLEESTRWENLYKENLYVDGMVDNLQTKQDEGKYVSIYALSIADEWNDGRSNTEDWLSGKSKVSNVVSELKAYDNMITWADEILPDYAKNGLISMPIKPNVDITNPEIAKTAQEALIFKPGMSNDQYISGLRKYYDTEAIESVVNNAFAGKNFYKGRTAQEEATQKAILTDYIVNSLGEDISFEQKVVANDNLERSRLALDREKHQWDMDKEMYKREMDVSYNEGIDRDVKDMGQEYADYLAQNPTATKEQKRMAYRNIIAKGGFYSEEWSNRIGLDVSKVPMSEAEMNKVNRGLKPNEANVSYGGVNYKLSEATEQLRIAKEKGDDKAIDVWTGWTKVLSDADENGGVIDYYVGTRLVAPMSVSVDKNGNVKKKAGQYVDGSGELKTLNIDASTSYIGKNDKGEYVVLQMPGSLTVYTDLSVDNVKAERDAINPQLSKQAKIGEIDRQGGVTTGASVTTVRKR